MREFEASQRQEDIFQEWRNTDNNILINAVAGSGKTTTLLKLVEYCQYKTLFLAFNKSVQEEIQAKLDERGLTQGKSLTLHGLGLSAVRNSYSKIKINANKNFDILKRIQLNFKDTFKKYPWKERVRIGYTLMDMNDISRLFLTENLEEIKLNLISMDKSLFEFEDLQELWEAFVAHRESMYSKRVLELDFVDMIYIPVIKNLHIPIDPYYLMVDESQDLNLCQHTLIDNLINQGDVNKWIAVGDRNQSIYGFSGSYSTSFDLFLEKSNVKEFPLDICYRCATSIIDSANEVYPVMEYSSAAVGIVGIETDVSLIKDNSMVICRNSGPLIDLYFRLLGQNKQCYIKGEEILQSIVRFLTPFKAVTVGTAKIEMSRKLTELLLDESSKGKMELYRFKENYDNFIRLSVHFCNNTEAIMSLMLKLKSLFVNKKDAIMLCTIHKSKGLEADVVYILNENLIPSKFARSPEQLKQEENLRYVARTRAKKEMYFLNLNGKQ
jgi:DNA helicase-2/ATP-dependent DNA helicase PcrA